MKHLFNGIINDANNNWINDVNKYHTNLLAQNILNNAPTNSTSTQNYVTSRVKNCLNGIHLTKLIFYTKILTFSKLILGNKILWRLGTKFGPELSSPNKVQALFPLPSFRFRFWLFCVVYRLRLELILRLSFFLIQLVRSAARNEGG